MTALFDGVPGLLAGVFGAPSIIWRPDGLSPITVTSVFRILPIEVSDDTGEAVQVMAPVWRVPRDPSWPRAPRRGDLIELADGRVFRLMAAQPSGSPAVDHFLHFRCEDAT